MCCVYVYLDDFIYFGGKKLSHPNVLCCVVVALRQLLNKIWHFVHWKLI